MAYLAVCGHTNIDILLQLDELPAPGASRPVRSRHTVYGGTACNIARHAAGLGVPTRLWSRVGPDFPEDWRTQLAAAGLDLAHLDVDPERGTPTCYVLTDRAGNQSYCMDQAAMGAMLDHPPTGRLVLGMPEGSWLHLGTGSPEAWQDVLAAARGQGMQIAIDPGQEIHFSYDRESLAQMVESADLLWANESEADEACRLLGLERHEDLVQHAGTVVVTYGERGLVLLRAGTKPVRMDAVRVEAPVDPTGAGDALRAGFYAGLHQGLGIEEALMLGQHAAAACVAMHGPQEETITRSVLPPALAR